MMMFQSSARQWNMANPFEPGDLVAIYLRDSGGDEQELSVDQQERVIREWANRNNVMIGKRFADSVSGTTTDNRVNFLKMISYFQHEAPERGVLIWRSNRFGRNIDDVQYFKADLRRRGYIVHSITDNIPDGPMGKLIEFALDWKDEVFSQQLSEDVKRGLADLVRQYGAVPGNPPRGFIRQPVTIGTRRNGQPHTVHKWIPDPGMIPTIQRAFEMRARGATLHSIQDDTKLYSSVNGWCTFFANKIYKGILEFGQDVVIENYCQPIVSPELWQAANNTGLQRRHVAGIRSQMRRQTSSYLLSGLVRCQRCGALMSGNTVQRWRYYACSRKMTHFNCDALQVRAEILEDRVITELINHVLGIDNMMAIQARLVDQYSGALEDVTTRRAELSKRLGIIAKSQTNLLADISMNGPSESIGKMLRSLEVEQADIRVKLQALDAQIRPPDILTTASMADIANAITGVLTDGDIEQKRYYIKAFIKSISVMRDGDAIRGCIQYYPPFLCKQPLSPWGHSYDYIMIHVFSYERKKATRQ
jgi:site-specific DNA recombinase